MNRCDKCNKEFTDEFPDVAFNAWLQLMHYFEHERLEGEITDATCEYMTDALMLIKPIIEDQGTDAG